MIPHRVYKFDSFSLDATAKVLLREGQPVTMTRKAVETLLVLAENAGQVVPKEDLLKAIWPDRVVDEANLTQNIAMVRKGLAVDRGSSAYIETFPGRGYRLVGPVELEVPLPISAVPSKEPESPVEPEVPPVREAIKEPSARINRKGVLFGLIVLVAVAIGIWSLLRRTPPRVEAEFRITPLTRLAGKEWQPALSPNGRMLAFVAEIEEGQPPEIQVQLEGASASRRISQLPGHYNSPAWAPDGQALAFLRIGKAATDVLIVPIHNDGTAGAERLVARLTSPNYGNQYRLLDWSPDGRRLAISYAETRGQPNAIYLLDLATAEKTALTRPEQMVGGDLEPRFSHDGKLVSFVRQIHRSHQELYAVPVAGGTPVALTTDKHQISSHAWLSAGSETGSVVFASDRSGEYRLWKLRPDTNEPFERLEVFDSFPIELSTARGASRLAYSIEQQDRNIWRLDLKEKRWNRVIASSAQDASPRYSPDGRRICFRSDRSGSEQLWVSDSEGGNQAQITQGDLYPSVGSWSPDGTAVIFNNARTGEIFLAEMQAGNQWRLRSTGMHGVHPIFSPDGEWIFAGSEKQILKFPVTGGASIPVVEIGGFSLGLSQDGRRLFFKRDPKDGALWQVDLATGAVSTAFDGLLPGCTSCWALAAEGIYYLGSDKNSYDSQAIYFHRYSDPAGAADRLITKYPEPLAPVGSGPFSLSPDFQSLLCVRMSPTRSDIMQVEPFR